MSDIFSRYRCGVCRAHGCKLWRHADTADETAVLLCGGCALVDQGYPGPIDELGTVRSPLLGAARTVQIGWYIPAIPDLANGSYWGFTAVPKEDLLWWRSLPNEGTR